MKETLREILAAGLAKMNVEMNEIAIEVPKDTKNGDFASNIAMQLASTLHKSPRAVAEELVSIIDQTPFAKVEIAGPGFINFYFKKDDLLNTINQILTDKEDYGTSTVGKGKKINVEFVSANPTGILHLGHARGASYGDGLCNVLAFAGYEVTREYYINDAGNQIVNLAKSIEGRYRGLCGLEENMPENGYHGKEIIGIAEAIYEIYHGEMPDSEVFHQKGLDYLLNQIKEDLNHYRVSFDLWSSEKAIYESGLLEQTLEKLKQSGYTYEQEGALWLKTTTFGDEKDRVLIKTDGTNTYFLPDIAYHTVKYSRGYDELIDIFGADHHGYVPRLKAAMEIMGEDPNKLTVQILQMVRLVRDGEEVKMSKRTGNAVTINELVDEVGLDATRYFFAMRSIDSRMDFDLDLALKKDSDNPVFYVQYANARICSIIRESGMHIDATLTYNTLTSQYALDLVRKLYHFEEVVEIAAHKKAPHLITNYAYELATLFHAFYNHEKVLQADTIMTQERINLIQAVSITICNALNLIGVSAPEKM